MSHKTAEQLEKELQELQHKYKSLKALYDAKISEHKLSQTNNPSQLLIQTIINLIPIRVFWKDKDLKFLGCNMQFAKDAGRISPEELIGKSDYEMNWAEQAELYRTDDLNVINTGKAKLNYEEQQTTPTGDKIWAKTSKVPLTDFQGNTIGVLGIFEDITEQKYLESLKEKNTELLIAKEKAEISKKISSDFIIELTKEKAKTEERKLQLQAKNKKLKETGLELKRYQEHLEELVHGRTIEIQQLNEELLTSNEELYVVNEDILEKREELQNSLTKLQETQSRLIHSEKMASLGLLASGIAHEINNPLNFIHGGTMYIEEHLKDKFPEIYNELEPVLAGINTGVERATLIVKSLNQYSRSDALAFLKCNLHDVIDNCLVMLQNQYKNRIEVNRQYTADLHIFEGNEGKLHQAFLNILANAGQAIDDKGEITIETAIVNRVIQIIINDNGHGISDCCLKRIFDPFYTTKEPGKGTGLGLSITYAIIQEHNGTIEFESKIGIGTKVLIKLPLKDEKASK